MLQSLSLLTVGKFIGGINRFILQSSSINAILLSAQMRRERCTTAGG
jgi:hypothetical protein